MGLSEFVAQAQPEMAANAMLCAVNQAAYLLRCQLESQGRAFLAQGGFTESLYTARTRARSSQSRSGKSDRSDRSDMSDKSRLRNAKPGRR